MIELSGAHATAQRPADELEAALLRALEEHDGETTARDLAASLRTARHRTGAALQRLAKRGLVQATAGSGRYGHITLYFQTHPRRSLGMPDWLEPRRLPADVLAARRCGMPIRAEDDDEDDGPEESR